MKSLISLTILISLTTSNVFADELSMYLYKDEKAPYAGILMPESKVTELRNNTLERDTLRLQNNSLNTSLKLQDDIIAKKTDQVTILLDQNDKLAKIGYSERSMTNLERVGYFALGVLATYGAFKVAQTAVK